MEFKGVSLEPGWLIKESSSKEGFKWVAKESDELLDDPSRFLDELRCKLRNRLSKSINKISHKLSSCLDVDTLVNLLTG